MRAITLRNIHKANGPVGEMRACIVGMGFTDRARRIILKIQPLMGSSEAPGTTGDIYVYIASVLHYLRYDMGTIWFSRL